ncbi:MAG: flagellin [Myxococcota bacterium]
MPAKVGYSSNSASQMANRQVGRAGQARLDASQNISTGKKVNSASDNAANIAIAMSMLSEQGGVKQAYRNAQEGVAMLQTAESGYQNMTDVLIRMRELAVQSSSDSFGAQDRKAMNTEFQDLADELNRMSGSTEYNGIPLMNGQAGSAGVVTFQVGTGGTASDGISAMLNAQDTDALGLTSAGVSDPVQASSAISAIDGAIKQLAADRSKLGSSMNALGGATEHLSAQFLANSSALSNVQDADFGSESTALAGAGIREQVAVAMLSQANQNPDAVLRLLG